MIPKGWFEIHDESHRNATTRIVTDPYSPAIYSEETSMLYTAVSLSLFGAAYAFLVSLTIF